MRALRLTLVALVLLAGFATALSMTSNSATAKPTIAKSCSAGYVDAIIDGQAKCLRAGEFCSSADESQYESFGFTCLNGHLEDYTGSTTAPPPTTTSGSTTGTPATTTAPNTTTAAITTTSAATTVVSTTSAVTTSVTTSSSSPPPGATARCADGSYSFSQTRSGTCSHHGGVAEWLPGAPAATATTASSPSSSGTAAGVTPALGPTVRLAARTKSTNCRRSALPDRRCSPGADYGSLTRAVICSGTFRTGSVRDVSDAEKHQVEVEYGMPPKAYGRTIEIDHIVSLELGGSNDISNLFPEPGAGPDNYHVKDRLENRLHQMVCSGAITLHAAQVGIARNWETLYTRVFGTVA